MGTTQCATQPNSQKINFKIKDCGKSNILIENPNRALESWSKNEQVRSKKPLKSVKNFVASPISIRSVSQGLIHAGDLEGRNPGQQQ